MKEKRGRKFSMSNSWILLLLCFGKSNQGSKNLLNKKKDATLRWTLDLNYKSSTKSTRSNFHKCGKTFRIGWCEHSLGQKRSQCRDRLFAARVFDVSMLTMLTMLTMPFMSASSASVRQTPKPGDRWSSPRRHGSSAKQSNSLHVPFG